MALACTSSSSALFFSSANPNPPAQRQPHLLLQAAAVVFPRRGRRRTPRASSSGPRRLPSFPPEAVVVVSDPRAWREIRAFYEDEEYDSDGDDDGGGEEEDDRSLDLLVRFLHSVFRKVSRRVRKAVRAVLPVSISAKLVGFSVDGVLILAFLWILKAFLEVPAHQCPHARFYAYGLPTCCNCTPVPMPRIHISTRSFCMSHTSVQCIQRSSCMRNTIDSCALVTLQPVCLMPHHVF